MSDLDPWRDQLNQILKLRNDGELAEALRLVETCIEDARTKNQVTWVDTLTLFGLLVAESTGDVALVREYAERAFCEPPERPAGKARALFAVAEVLFRNGDTHSAKRHAAMSYALVAHGQSETEKSLRQLLLQKWPQVAEW